jgi:simple sugar transport system permease protein
MQLRFERRLNISRIQSLIMPFVSIAFALLLGALLILITGRNPLDVYKAMFIGAIGSPYSLSETLVKAIPLMLAGLGVGIAARGNLWNLGAEGQVMMGAVAASWLPIFHPDLPGWVMVPGMLLMGFIIGGFWAVIASMPRILWGINEVITTLMSNYIAMYWVNYLVTGPWRDRQLVAFPFSVPFPSQASLPTFWGTRIHLGIVFAIFAACILWVLLNRTKWGYELRIIGSSNRVAKYAGMNVARNLMIAMLISGGLAGIAGMAEVTGVFHRLQEGIAANAGYNAFVLVGVAGSNPFGLLTAAILFGVLLTGSISVQTFGVSSQISQMLQGLILLAVIASSFILRYRIYIEKKKIA